MGVSISGWKIRAAPLTQEVGVFEDVQLTVHLLRGEVELPGLSLQDAQLLASVRVAVLDHGQVSLQAVQVVSGVADLSSARRTDGQMDGQSGFEPRHTFNIRPGQTSQMYLRSSMSSIRVPTAAAVALRALTMP